jgi:hypothetical protein
MDEKSNEPDDVAQETSGTAGAAVPVPESSGSAAEAGQPPREEAPGSLGGDNGGG